MKAVLASNCLNVYPNLNKPFKIVTDASNYQLGACILQEGRPVAYFSKKLDAAQRNYTTLEKELLSIVLTLKEYRKILWGGKITVWTDHKNLTFRTMSVQRVLRWRAFIDEFDVELKYIEGSRNVIADAFSRLPRMDGPASVGDELLNENGKRRGTKVNFHQLKTEIDTTDDEIFVAIDEDNELIEYLLNLPELDQMHNPINMQNIYHHQRNDPNLVQLLQREPQFYRINNISGIDIITFQQDDVNPNQWKICLPNSLMPDVVKWYHYSRSPRHTAIVRFYLGAFHCTRIVPSVCKIRLSR